VEETVYFDLNTKEFKYDSPVEDSHKVLEKGLKLENQQSVEENQHWQQQSLNFAAEQFQKIEKLKQRFPNLTKWVGNCIEAVTLYFRNATYVQAGLAGAKWGSSFPTVGPVVGAAVGTTGVYIAEKLAEDVISSGIEKAGDQAASLAQTDQQAEKNRETIYKSANLASNLFAVQGVGKKIKGAKPSKNILQEKPAKTKFKEHAQPNQPHPEAFYNAHEVKTSLETRYHGKVTSTTVPDISGPNVKLAGKRHPKTGVVFDQRGFPIFDDLAIFDTKISREVFFESNQRKPHFRTATKSLRSAIEKGQVSKSLFNEKQLKQIEKGAPKIEGYTWHHHQDPVRMQLIPQELHNKTNHIGSMNLIHPKKKR